MPKEAIFLVIE
jgi:hypothetical protein